MAILGGKKVIKKVFKVGGVLGGWKCVRDVAGRRIIELELASLYIA